MADLVGCNPDSFRKVSSDGKSKQGREVLYDYRAFFQIAEHLLNRGELLSEGERQRRFLKQLLERLDDQCPAEVAKADMNFVKAMLVKIRERPQV